MNDSPHTAARHNMIERQLRRRGIVDERVLEAMAAVPREEFVQPEDSAYAYDDGALRIECGQTISQPYIVALMSEALQLSGDEQVLEVGTGSGYQAAVLSRLAGKVVTIERHEPLSRHAEATLRRLGCENVECVVGDGTLGWPEEAPYDRIMVTANAPRVPQALLDQLANGGLLVAPVGTDADQWLRVYRKQGNKVSAEDLTACRFVPLIGQQGVPE